jgi:hypothetical protein
MRSGVTIKVKILKILLFAQIFGRNVLRQSAADFLRISAGTLSLNSSASKEIQKQVLLLPDSHRWEFIMYM